MCISSSNYFWRHVLLSCYSVNTQFMRDNFPVKFWCYGCAFSAVLQCFDAVGWAAGRASGL